MAKRLGLPAAPVTYVQGPLPSNPPRPSWGGTKRPIQFFPVGGPSTGWMGDVPRASSRASRASASPASASPASAPPASSSSSSSLPKKRKSRASSPPSPPPSSPVQPSKGKRKSSLVSSPPRSPEVAPAPAPSSAASLPAASLGAPARAPLPPPQVDERIPLTPDEKAKVDANARLIVARENAAKAQKEVEEAEAMRRAAQALPASPRVAEVLVRFCFSSVEFLVLFVLTKLLGCWPTNLLGC